MKWKHFRYRLEYVGLWLGAWIIQRLPLYWLRPLGNFIGEIVFFLDRHRREVALSNLKVAFGEKYNEADRQKIARQSYGTFASSVLELLWSPNLNPSVVDRVATMEGLYDKSPHAQAGVPVIYCCLHAGNFEWIAQFTSRYVSLFPLIAQQFKNPYIGPLFDRWRSSMGNPIIPQERAMLKMLRHLKSGGKMGLLIDLNLKPHEGPVVIRCFNRVLVPVTPLPAELAFRTGALLIPSECLPRANGGHHVRFLDPIPVTPGSTVASLTQACWDALESTIQEHPELWLWSYKHWRYLPSDASPEDYPFYANKNKDFDELLEQQGIKKDCESESSMT